MTKEFYESGAPHFEAYVFPFYYDGTNIPSFFTLNFFHQSGTAGSNGGYFGPIDVYAGANPRVPHYPPRYAVMNANMDRTFDANSTSTKELADVLATLIEDLGL